MIDIGLQPKQCLVQDLLDSSPAAWLGVGGGRGCSKSFLIDALMIQRRVELPGTVGCIVMRNYDQVRKYHIEPIVRNWPELEQFLNKGDSNLKLPCAGGGFSQLDFSYAEDLASVERRFRSANYYDVMVDQAEQFMEDELREMKKACRWPRTPVGRCKMLLSFNMGGAGIQTLKKWFHTREYNERENPENFEFVHVFPWDNVEWSRAALEQDGLTEQDYYSWTDFERMEYCASRSEYGKELNSEDDALRNRDWLGSWDSLEGAYFGRVFDRKSTLIDANQVAALIKPWDTRWLSQDWGKSHYCSTHWHAQTVISPGQVERVLGWKVSQPVNAVITYRELVVNEMASPDVARAIAAATPPEERKFVKEFFLSPDAFGERDSENTTAQNLATVLREFGLPEPEQADNDRRGGWSLMYDLLQDTKCHGSVDANIWLIGGECPELLNALPVLMRDPKNLDDVLKTDKGAARIEQDVSDSARYGLKSKLSPRLKAPLEVRARAVYDAAKTPTDKHLAMLAFKDREAKRGRAIAGKNWRS